MSGAVCLRQLMWSLSVKVIDQWSSQPLHFWHRLLETPEYVANSVIKQMIVIAGWSFHFLSLETDYLIADAVDWSGKLEKKDTLAIALHDAFESVIQCNVSPSSAGSSAYAAIITNAPIWCEYQICITMQFLMFRSLRCVMVVNNTPSKCTRALFIQYSHRNRVGNNHS